MHLISLFILLWTTSLKANKQFYGQKLEYFKNDGKKKVWHLNADSGLKDAQKKWILHHVTLESWDDQNLKTVLKSEQATYFPPLVLLKKNVNILFPDKSKFHTASFKVNLEKNTIYSSQPMQGKYHAVQVQAQSFCYDKKQQKIFLSKADFFYPPSTHLSATSAMIDLKKERLELTGFPILLKEIGHYEAHAQKALVHFISQKIDFIRAEGDVQIHEILPTQKRITRAEKAFFQNEQIILTGKPHIQQPQGNIQSEKIILNTRSKILHLYKSLAHSVGVLPDEIKNF